MYGLTVDRWVDERLDPERATQAAIRFLSDLYRRFGSWELAMASYNMGYGGMSRAIQKFNSNDFWELSRYEAGIPWETTLYVPKIFAIAIVMNNKKSFGIHDVTPDSPESFDTVLIEPGKPLSEVAQAAGVPTETLEGMNAAYLAGRTPPSADRSAKARWPVRVPSGKGTLTSQHLAKGADKDDGLKPYRVRFGDTLENVATAHGVTATRLRRLNRIDRDERLRQGTVLLTPRTADAAQPKKELPLVIVPPRAYDYPQRRRVFYEAQSGDTLDEVAAAFDVSRSELIAWNAIDDGARLQPGMHLQVFTKLTHSLSAVRYTDPGSARLLVAGTPEFYDYFEGLKGKRRILITIKSGDTLRSIGARFGMSVGWMERVNRRSRRDELKPGETLVVYTSPALAAGARQAGDGADPKPLAPAKPPQPEALPSVPASLSASK
jgi:membrane-bound lytic murein transglycosylase D